MDWGGYDLNMAGTVVEHNRNLREALMSARSRRDAHLKTQMGVLQPFLPENNYFRRQENKEIKAANMEAAEVPLADSSSGTPVVVSSTSGTAVASSAVEDAEKEELSSGGNGYSGSSGNSGNAPQGFEDVSYNAAMEGVQIVRQPDMLTAELHAHQTQGVSWMAHMHHKGCPMILGDQMGLGKTVQSIGYMAYLKDRAQKLEKAAREKEDRQQLEREQKNAERAKEQYHMDTRRRNEAIQAAENAETEFLAAEKYVESFPVERATPASSVSALAPTSTIGAAADSESKSANSTAAAVTLGTATSSVPTTSNQLPPSTCPTNAAVVVGSVTSAAVAPQSQAAVARTRAVHLRRIARLTLTQLQNSIPAAPVEPKPAPTAAEWADANAGRVISRGGRPWEGQGGPFLVVVPLSVLANWISEIERFCPSLISVRFHGPKEERMRIKTQEMSSLEEFDVVVTTYVPSYF